MSNAVGQIFADDINATQTPGSTVFERFPGSTLFEGESGGNEYIKVEPENTSGVRMVTGINGKGLWQVSWCGSITASVGNKLYHAALFKNSSKIKATSREFTIGTAGAYNSMAGSAFIVLNGATDIIDWRIKSTVTAQITVSHLSFRAGMVSTSTVLNAV